MPSGGRVSEAICRGCAMTSPYYGLRCPVLECSYPHYTAVFDPPSQGRTVVARCVWCPCR